MDQHRTFPRIYSPHLIDYFRTWGFKAGQEFLTLGPWAGCPRLHCVTWGWHISWWTFLLKVEGKPWGTTERSHRQRLKFERIIWHSGPPGTYFNTDSFFLVYSAQGSFSLKDHGIICWKSPDCVLKPFAALGAVNMCIPSTTQVFLAAGSQDTSLEDPVRDTHKVPCRDKNVSHNPIFFSRGLNYSRCTARLWTMNSECVAHSVVKWRLQRHIFGSQWWWPHVGVGLRNPCWRDKLLWIWSLLVKP